MKSAVRVARAVRPLAFLIGSQLLLAGFDPGGASAVETLRYRISWNGIPAADATVILAENVGPDPQVTHLRIEARTNRFVDLFWSLRAASWSDVDAATLRTRLFEYDRRINGRLETTRVDAGPDGVLTGRYARPGRYELMEVADPNVLDPIAAVLRARRDLPPVGGTVSYQIFTGEARYRIDWFWRGVETINSSVGRFTAARIEPTVWRSDRQGRDTRVRALTIWVRENAPHLLLRARSEVFVGALYVDLVECSDCRH